MYYPNATLEAVLAARQPPPPKVKVPKNAARQIGSFPPPERPAMSEGRKYIQIHMCLENMFPGETQLAEWVEAAFLAGWLHAQKLTGEVLQGILLLLTRVHEC